MKAIDVLRRSALFEGIDEVVLEELAAATTELHFASGDIVFEEEAPGFDAFVIASGIVEVRKTTDGGSRAVNYLSAGECLGELSLITGLPRSATVRVPQSATLFRIPGLMFERLCTSNARFALNIARVLAYRLQIANQLHVGGSMAPCHLSGDLEFFDLPELCQTIALGRRTGVLVVAAPSLEGEAALFFKDGELHHVAWIRADGADAAIYILRSVLEGTFEFRTTEGYAGPSEEPQIRIPTLGLGLEALRQRDELGALEGQLPAPETALLLTDDEPVEVDGIDPALFTTLLGRLRSGTSRRELLEAYPVHALAVFRLLAALNRAGRL